MAFWFPRTPNAVKTSARLSSAARRADGRIILHDRLEREAERAGSPLLSAGVSLRQPVRPLEAHVVGAVVADGRTAEGLATIAGVIGRLRRFGPRPSELAHARENLLDERRKALPASSPRTSRTRSSNSTSAAIRCRVRRRSTRWTNELLPAYRRAGNGCVRRRSRGRAGTDDLITSPGQRRHAESPVRCWPRWTARPPTSPRRQPDSLAGGGAHESFPGRGPLFPVARSPDIGAHEWTLANGMRVLLKPTLSATTKSRAGRCAWRGVAGLAGGLSVGVYGRRRHRGHGRGEVSGAEVSRCSMSDSFPCRPR